MKKRNFIAVLVAVLMAFSLFASACGESHHFSDVWSSDSSNHWHACTDDDCSEKADEAAHTFDGEICSVCDYNKGHNWSSAWESDTNDHWHKCTNEGCTEISDKAAHTMVNDSCSVCGYSVNHAWSQVWENDETNHWHACTNSDCTTTNDFDAHIFEGDTCSVCGYKKAHTHNWSEWKYEETIHWRECSDCDEADGKAQHTFEGNTCSICGYTKPEETVESTPLTGKVYVVGDSTVCDYRPKLDDYYLPRYGYGTMLYNYLNCDEDQIVNLALSGRSSKSFLTEANYATLVNSISAGDYLIIGFGHNDEKSDDAARFTDPVPDYQTASSSKGSSFQYTLYENYVKLAKDVGATPILCTPIVRYNATGEYDNKSVSHVTSDGDYAAAIIKLGADTNTAVVDLTGITKEYYKANNDTAKYFHAYTTYNENGSDKIPDGIDTTHINMYGAKMIAYWLVTNLPAGCPMKAHVQNDIAAPTYEVDFPEAIKSDYVKPDYSGFNPADHASNKVGTIGDGEWYHTAMGVLGGASKVGEYAFTNNNGAYTITTGTGSKFAGTQDGFGAIFTQIDITKNFTVSAKAKVTGASASLDNQNAFGIMLRDDIYIDTHDTTIASNFVSASVNGKGSANMSRTSKTALDYDGTIAFAQDVEYEITLIRVGQVVTATVTLGSNTVTTTFTDISYVGIDNNYMYLCLFANRGLAVEFSDVTFEITGEAQGA